MSGMRVSDLGQVSQITNAIAANSTRLSDIQLELSSGQRINAPSDDPTGTALDLRLRAQLARYTQLSKTANQASARLSAAQASLQNITSLLQEARALVVQAGNATLNSSQLSSMAAQVNQYLGQLVQIGNSNFAGQYLFGGTQTTTPPFSVQGTHPSAVTYQGDSGPVNLDIGGTVRVDVPGNGALLDAANALIQVRDALESGNNATAVSTGLTAMDGALSGLLTLQGDVGSRINALNDATSRMSAQSLVLQNEQTQIESTDITAATVQLQSAQNVFQASLQAAARALQSSLANFLK